MGFLPRSCSSGAFWRLDSQNNCSFCPIPHLAQASSCPSPSPWRGFHTLWWGTRIHRDPHLKQWHIRQQCTAAGERHIGFIHPLQLALNGSKAASQMFGARACSIHVIWRDIQSLSSIVNSGLLRCTRIQRPVLASAADIQTTPLNIFESAKVFHPERANIPLRNTTMSCLDLLKTRAAV